jgi:hypothetical protein
VPPEPRRIVVAGIKRQPRHGPAGCAGPSPPATPSFPTRPGRRPEPAPCQPLIEGTRQPRARHEAQPRPGYVQLGGQQHVPARRGNAQWSPRGRLSHRRPTAQRLQRSSTPPLVSPHCKTDLGGAVSRVPVQLMLTRRRSAAAGPMRVPARCCWSAGSRPARRRLQGVAGPGTARADLSLCGEPCGVPSSLGWFCDDGTRRRLLRASPDGTHRGESSAANPGAQRCRRGGPRARQCRRDRLRAPRARGSIRAGGPG